ncbi:MAG: helix-turn-helix domain-containing protein [Pseudonocardiaceae bacterium]
MVSTQACSRTRGWRQADLAKAGGYSASTISRLETNRRASIDVEMLRRVEHAAGIPGDVLGALLGLPASAPARRVATQARFGGSNQSLRALWPMWKNISLISVAVGSAAKADWILRRRVTTLRSRRGRGQHRVPAKSSLSRSGVVLQVAEWGTSVSRWSCLLVSVVLVS